MAEAKTPKGDKTPKGAASATKKGAAKGTRAPRRRPRAPRTSPMPARSPRSPKAMSRACSQHYDEVVRPKLIEEFGYKNANQVPTIEKIVLNMGVGDAVNDTKKVTLAAADLALIAGQKPVITRARQAISTFKVRENMPIGAKVTLRKTRMYEFLDRFITVALPRVRDFRGLNPKSFDGRGNFAMGIKEHLVFPEIDYDKVDTVLGMDVIVCTTAKTDDEARALLRAFNFPFRQ